MEFVGDMQTCSDSALVQRRGCKTLCVCVNPIGNLCLDHILCCILLILVFEKLLKSLICSKILSLGSRLSYYKDGIDLPA